MSRVELPSARPAPTQIELSIISEPAKREPEPEPAQPPQAVAMNEAPRTEPVVPPVPARRRERERKSQPRESTSSELTPAPSGPAESEPEVATVENSAPSQPSVAVPSQPSRGAIDLSPHRAAASMVDQLEMPVPVCNPRGSSSEAAACSPSDRAAFVQRELDESFRQAANAPKYRVKRDAPELHREGDGGFRYDGPVFTARIRGDGGVDFADSTSGVDGLATIGPGVRGHFDPSDMLDHALTGKELYSAEKRWFLEQTVELREKLTAAARDQERSAARRSLERALEQILAARELGAAHKRERILALWDDCGDDAEATDARRIVQAFVRARLPEGSDLGFTREELERFNRGRSGVRVFDPYRS